VHKLDREYLRPMQKEAYTCSKSVVNMADKIAVTLRPTKCVCWNCSG
jgi:hypothetical protein